MVVRVPFLLVVTLIDVVNFVDAFGKYLQLQHKKQRVQNQLESEMNNVTIADKAIPLTSFGESRSEQPANNISNDDNEAEKMEIEIVAAILIASIFIIFFLIYLVFLQCWWRCSDKYRSFRRPSSPTAATTTTDLYVLPRQEFDEGGIRTCFLATKLALEPMLESNPFLSAVVQSNSSPDR